ncbi:MAG: YggS family pyridoxal phosphate-dependent enzyme [Planctomycetaceae bacterium]|nr:YggS family pyridoxal phosphate-dependent enzyme [Planctomycetaceae bacterium]
MTQTTSQNLNVIQQKMTSACQRAGRSPNEVQLVAVTKYAQLEWVQGLIDLGHMDLGESRPQQLSERCETLSDSITWHMIGHLQRNKVRSVLETGAIIHSVDSQRLLERIESLAQEMNVTAEVFIEVNISHETSKHGFSPDEVSSVVPLLKDSPHIKALGMMTMAPYAEDPEESRPYFRELRELQTLLNKQLPDDRKLSSLSMGMSGDFEVAIEEGATHIRIGSALFEGLSND